MELDLRRIAEFVRKAETEELLDRVTVYRKGMEPAALDLMELELDRRGITRNDIADHYLERSETAIFLPDGTALRCTFCNRPAVERGWALQRFFGPFRVFPRYSARCREHARRPK